MDTTKTKTNARDYLMTHDELLLKLFVLPADITEQKHEGKAIKALRAVIELHKPDDEGDCLNCLTNLAWRNYPCPTIQVIEKELS